MNGIYAFNSTNGTTLTVSANNATGGISGILTHSFGSGGATVNLTGTATGGTGAAIDTTTAAGGPGCTTASCLTTINLAAGSSAVAGSSGIAIRNNGGNSVLNVASGASISGEVRLGDGNDIANISGTNALAGITVLDGGDDAGTGDGMIDVLTLTGVTATLNSGQIINWETLSLINSNLTATGLVTNQVNVCGGSTTLTSSTIGAGGVLGCVANDAITLTGTTTVAGPVQGAGGSDTIAVLGSGSVSGGDGNDFLYLGGGSVAGALDGGDGDDLIIQNGGSSGSVSGGTGNDTFVLYGDSTGTVSMGDGDDASYWFGGTLTSFDGGLGSDTLTITASGYNGTQVLDGGDDAGTGDGMIDVLTLNGVSGTADGTIVNWETLGLINSNLTVNNLVTNQVNVCGGSTTIGGASVIGAGGVLGCVYNDSITLDGTTTVAGPVEGAGGSDTIAVLGSASVSGGVFGGSAGQDGSAAYDGADSITINTSGTVSLVDGQLGNDTINLNSGTITGSVVGGDGDDTVNWNAAAATTPLVSMGNGSDVVNINSAAINLTSVVLNGGDDVSTADGWTDTLNLNAAWSGSLNGANTTNWEVININGGTVDFSNAAITAGVINVNGGGTLNASNNLAVTGNVAISAGSRMVVGTAGGTGTASISGNLTNSGTVDFRSMTGASATGDKLTIGGNYTGAAGSVIHFDTVLGGSHATDMMVVGGNLGGFSAVTIHNVGGTGALTTGDGIHLVQVNGSSATNGLALSGGPIDVGAFRYTLYNGGLANPADQDWYLRSAARDIVVPTASIGRVAQDAGLNSLGTLHERVGEREHYTTMTLEDGVLKGMWGRALGKDYSETGQSASFGNNRSNGQFGGMQMGVDLYRGTSDNGSRTHVGVYGGYLWSGTTDYMTSPLTFLAGTTRSDGWVGALYATHYTPSGFYVDGVVQGNWLDHRANATDGTTFSTKSDGWLASLEMGKSFGSKWKLEPQVQLIYSHTGIDGFTDSTGVVNSIDTSDSWTGRAGFRLKRTWDYNPNNDSGQFTFYGKANIWGTLSGGQTTLTVGVSAPGAVQYKGVWGDVGAGTTFSIGKGAEFFADADVEFGIDQGATALSGRAGLRIRW